MNMILHLLELRERNQKIPKYKNYQLQLILNSSINNLQYLAN